LRLVEANLDLLIDESNRDERHRLVLYFLGYILFPTKVILSNEFMSKTTRKILLSCLSIGAVMALCLLLTLIALVIMLIVG
jgi:hypothetical protein